MKKLSKIVSVVLSLALCLGMASPAFAAVALEKDKHIDGTTGALLSHEEENEAGETVESYDYYLDKDVTLDKTLVIKGGVNASIDLNGHNLALNDSNQVTKDEDGYTANVTVKDSSGKTKSGEVIRVTGVETKLSVADTDDYGGNDGKTGTITGAKGYGVSVANGAKFSMTGGEISKNRGSGVSVTGSGSSFIMDGGKISDNFTTSDGGGVRLDRSATFTMNDGEITGNSSKSYSGSNGLTSGGGIYITGSDTTFTMTGGNITKNFASNSGGGIGALWGNVDLTAGEGKEINISDNYAGDYGGGISLSSTNQAVCKHTIDGVTLERNTSGYWGGGIRCNDIGSAVDISNTTLRDNNAASDGNAMLLQSKEYNITNCVVENSNPTAKSELSVRWAAKVNLADTTLPDVTRLETGSTLSYEGFTMSLDRQNNLTITDSNGKPVNAVQDGTGKLIKAGKLDAEIISEWDSKYIVLSMPISLHTHTPGAAVRENESSASCTRTGSYDRVIYCSGCGEKISETHVTIEKLAHTEVTDEAKAPTCTEDGLTAGKHCSVCGEVIVKQETDPATGHTEATDEAVAPTCTETGLTEGKHCSVCNEVLEAQERVEALGHTEVVDEAVPATTTSTGLTEGSHCDVCGEVIVAQEEIPMLPQTTPVFPIVPDDSTGADATPAEDTTTLEDQEVPLAGLMPVAQLLEELRQYEKIENVELPEDFKWLDHEYAQAIYWGLREELVADTEEDPFDPDEVITVALMREVLTNFVELYLGLDDFVVTVEGEDDEMVMDLGERLTAFYAELKAYLKAQESKAA